MQRCEQKLKLLVNILNRLFEVQFKKRHNYKVVKKSAVSPSSIDHWTAEEIKGKKVKKKKERDLVLKFIVSDKESVVSTLGLSQTQGGGKVGGSELQSLPEGCSRADVKDNFSQK